MGELANCRICNGLFVKKLREVCERCQREEDHALATVQRFLRLRKNKNATMAEVVAATGVEQDLILKFVKEKRILLSTLPNLVYGCAKCGTSISEGEFCYSCVQELQKDLNQQDDVEKRQKRNQVKENTFTYFTGGKTSKKQ